MISRPGPSFNYKTPASWSSPVDKVPVLLLLHFLLAIALVGHFVMLLVTFLRSASDRVGAITKPKWWSQLTTLIIAILVLALAAADAAVWGAAAGHRGLDFHPAALGYL